MTEFRYLNPIRIGRGLDKLQRVDGATHRAIHGKFRQRRLRDLTAIAEAVHLRGRGGAAFPFARKLTAVMRTARTRDCQPVVLVNATEGEPASAKDKFLLAHTPHLILDGAMLAAKAMGAREVVIGLTDTGPAARSLRSAVLESGLRDFVRLVQLPERFVTGEGGALVNGVNGGPALPPGRKVRAADRGVDGLPTLLSNAETYAQLALVSQLGPDLYSAVGTAEEPGTVLLTVWGADGLPRVIEAPAGVPMAQVLDLGQATTGQGVLVGGYHGAWITPAAANRACVSRESIGRAGGALGAGVIMTLGEDVCPLGEVARVAAYLGAESAGQCGPCRLGLPAIARSLNSLVAGRSTTEALSAVSQGTQTVVGRGACKHPDGSARFVTSALSTFAADVKVHLAKGTCGRPVRGSLPIAEDLIAMETAEAEETGLRMTVDWTRCAGHGLCKHLVPELIQLDEHGFPVISNAGVPRRLVGDARQAIEMCPALALRLGDSAAETRHAVKASR
ncbi:NADH-quinone oxidoreductase subunit NuoF family protein [Actinoallomurus bryophytorum]|uniref:NADH:ubiquinone oxidoreductase subunit F (NADH-binding) n=1 Tax=Actinoallomurus bryophytorum TaxID=1490222 RepID=A0A543CQ02_9ACTN|nr:NADH-quinone oxidoreductase subunit NuoF family protein [Actinoallomurus bryophytorum]TQL99173.1 NADH:ubiquinone oxidoreductase subunit F (NADH-binding) [Actinoallomurus bryophytorum]